MRNKFTLCQCVKSIIMYSNITDTNTTIFKRYTCDIENDTGYWQEKP